MEKAQVTTVLTRDPDHTVQEAGDLIFKFPLQGPSAGSTPLQRAEPLAPTVLKILSLSASPGGWACPRKAPKTTETTGLRAVGVRPTLPLRHPPEPPSTLGRIRAHT